MNGKPRNPARRATGDDRGKVGEGPSMIEHPPHYTFGKHEPIDVIEDWELGFHLGNCVKYIARAGRKGDVIEDLHKARWYLHRAIVRLEDARDAGIPEESR